jgi:lipopolysaccharide export LptBFGC system permease protein LptF
MDPSLQSKYSDKISTVNQMDDKIIQLEKEIATEIKKTAVTMKEEDKELNHLRKLFTTLENYAEGAGDLDKTSYQMLHEYELNYKYLRISYWIYVVVLLIFSYLLIYRSEDKVKYIGIVIGVVIISYLIRYLIRKWTEFVWFPKGPTEVKTIEEKMPEESGECTQQSCCGEGTIWNEETHQCILASF